MTFYIALVVIVLVTWILEATSRRAWYVLRTGDNVSLLAVGMSQADVFALVERDGQPSVESITESGFYFYRNGGCRVTVDSATGRVSRAEVDNAAVK